MVNNQASASIPGGSVFGSSIWTPFWDAKLNASAEAGAPLVCENMDVQALVGPCPNGVVNTMLRIPRSSLVSCDG